MNDGANVPFTLVLLVLTCRVAGNGGSPVGVAKFFVREDTESWLLLLAVWSGGDDRSVVWSSVDGTEADEDGPKPVGRVWDCVRPSGEPGAGFLNVEDTGLRCCHGRFRRACGASEGGGCPDMTALVSSRSMDGDNRYCISAKLWESMKVEDEGPKHV